MARTHIITTSVSGRSNVGSGMPVVSSVPFTKQTLVPSGTSQATAAAAPSGAGGVTDNVFWQITTDTDIWVAFGAAPVASAANDHLVLAGQTREFFAIAGHKCAVIQA